MNTTETTEGIDENRRGLLGAVTMGIAVAGAASLSTAQFAAAADENTTRPAHPTQSETTAGVTYDKQLAALLVVDPYNDFISVGGKLWDRVRAVAEANDCVPHMLQVLNAARKAELRIFYALHHRYRPGDYETWKYIAPIQKAGWKRKTFEYGTWGGEIRPESCLSQARLSLQSIGVQAASPTRIWICSSRSSASISSSSSDS
jgi:hypothetical protein